MRIRNLLVLALLAIVFISTGCRQAEKAIDDAEAEIHKFKAEDVAEDVLKETGETLGVEIYNKVKVSSKALDVSPAEEANGIQARASVKIEFAYRCPGAEEWVDAEIIFDSLILKDDDWEVEGKDATEIRSDVRSLLDCDDL